MITMKQMETMSDAQPAHAFLIEKPKTENRRVTELEDLLPELAAKLKKRYVIKKMVYEHYSSLCSVAFRLSAFLVRLNAYMGKAQPSHHYHFFA